jgi:hypothetical protein
MTQLLAEKLMLTVFWDLKGLFSKPVRNVEQQSQVHCIVTCFIENLNPQSALKKRKIFEGNFVVARQCPPPHIGNTQTIEVGGYGTSNLQYGFSAI